MIQLSQRDERWKDVEIDHSGATIGTDGCLLTAICNVRSKFFPHHIYKMPYTRPDELARLDIFNDAGEIIWAKLAPILESDFGMTFEERVYSYFPVFDDKKLKALCRNPDYGVAIEVRTNKGKRHWITLVNSSFYHSILGWASIDSWDGNFLWKSVGWFGRYVRITGYVVFRKSEKVAKMTAPE